MALDQKYGQTIKLNFTVTRKKIQKKNSNKKSPDIQYSDQFVIFGTELVSVEISTTAREAPLLPPPPPPRMTSYFYIKK